MSSAMEADSLRVEGKLQEAKNPASAVAKPSAGTAEFEQVHGMDIPTGTARSRTAVPLPSYGGNGMMHTGMEKATESEWTLSVSPVLSTHSQWERVDDGTGENGDGRVPLLEGDRTQLTDVNRQILYE